MGRKGNKEETGEEIQGGGEVRRTMRPVTTGGINAGRC